MQCAISFVLLLAITHCAQYTNPILPRDFPDPCILASTDGNYYVYATNTANIHFQVAMSTDGVNFQYKGDAMPTLPKWATGSTEQWAPHVIQYDDTNNYYMYFVAQSAELNGTRCIGVAKSESPLGPFIDASLDNKPLFCHDIDPFVLYLPTNAMNVKTFLYYGSASELKLQILNDDHVSINTDFKEKVLLYKNTSLDYQNLIEASWIHFKNGYYYYYFSGDNCCGNAAHYSVMIARSSDPLGPFYKKSHYVLSNNTDVDVVIHLNDKFNATGHLSILTDKNGDDWMYYHAYKIGQEDKGRMLLVDRIYYDQELWPFVNTTSPSYTQQIGPVL